MHHPERGGVEGDPHLIGRRAVTRHAVRCRLPQCEIERLIRIYGRCTGSGKTGHRDMHRHLVTFAPGLLAVRYGIGPP
jgi:hypothetical protein